jgi:GTP cyclohydrolase I
MHDEMVVLRGVRFQSLCEHHLLPFVGVAHVGYVPVARVVGLSKLARLVACFARRLQIQERMTDQIAQAIMEHLKPKGAAVVIEATHSCMAFRGAAQSDARMVTSSMLGVMREKPEARAEFLRLVG